MNYVVPENETKKAKLPHEIFLTNLIGNHILWFVAALGVVRSTWYPLLVVPVVSIACLGYVILRAKQAQRKDPWFVMCHWQISAKRSKIFLLMFMVFWFACLLGWVGYSYLGMMEEAVYAVIGGMGVLPIMVTTLVLIIMESDVLHQAGHGNLPKGVIERYPNPDLTTSVGE